MAVVKYKRVRDGAKIPTKATAGSVGVDLYACLDVRYILHGGEIAAIPCGIATEFPPEYFAAIRGRSGMATRGIFAFEGTVDSDYRGEWKVILVNHTNYPQVIQDGDRIAQFILLPAIDAVGVEVEELSSTERAEGGFGSTGQ